MSHGVKLPVFIFIRANLKVVTAAITKRETVLYLVRLAVEEGQSGMEWEGAPEDVIWKTPHLLDNEPLKRKRWVVAGDKV